MTPVKSKFLWAGSLAQLGSRYTGCRSPALMMEDVGLEHMCSVFGRIPGALRMFKIFLARGYARDAELFRDAVGFSARPEARMFLAALLGMGGGLPMYALGYLEAEGLKWGRKLGCLREWTSFY